MASSSVRAASLRRMCNSAKARCARQCAPSRPKGGGPSRTATERFGCIAIEQKGVGKIKRRGDARGIAVDRTTQQSDSFVLLAGQQQKTRTSSFQRAVFWEDSKALLNGSLCNSNFTVANQCQHKIDQGSGEVALRFDRASKRRCRRIQSAYREMRQAERVLSCRILWREGDSTARRAAGRRSAVQREQRRSEVDPDRRICRRKCSGTTQHGGGARRLTRFKQADTVMQVR